jgi:hypothetical protein
MKEDTSRKNNCPFKYNTIIKLTKKQIEQLEKQVKPSIPFACFAQPVLHTAELRCIFLNEEQYDTINRAISRASKKEQK